LDSSTGNGQLIRKCALSAMNGWRKCIVSNGSVSWGDEGLLGDEDAIQELSLILVSDTASLACPGASEGKSSIIWSIEDKLILNVRRLSDSCTWWKLNVVRFLTTQEVNNIERLLVLWDHNVDGEVIVHKSHLISEALGDANHHVGDE